MSRIPLHLYNTRTRTIEEFQPLEQDTVRMYNCGPTVYNFAHIGNLRAFVFADIVRRVLQWNGYQVQQVINITDVGHLVSDGDEGEDKMIVGATREGRSIEEIITEYSNAFYNDLEALNILAAEHKGQEASFPRATHHIDAQKVLIERLAEKGYVYTTSDGIYFDTSKFPAYPDFARLDISGLQAGARVELGEKKHATDFALWKFSPTDGKQREQEWDSPLAIDRKGFPGWHLECSAMAMKYLGETIDIHTGGIDHIPVHHTNEIAQSECATGKTFARYWMHSAFMNVDGQKMSKSLGNTYTLNDLVRFSQKGSTAMAFRYWLLNAHYRTLLNFSTDAFTGAEDAYSSLLNKIGNLGQEVGAANAQYLDRFTDAINNDLDTHSAMTLMWDLFKDDSVAAPDKLATLFRFDEVFGLGLQKIFSAMLEHRAPIELDQLRLEDEAAYALCVARIQARSDKNWSESDRLRDELLQLGYIVKDTPTGQQLTKSSI